MLKAGATGRLGRTACQHRAQRCGSIGFVRELELVQKPVQGHERRAGVLLGRIGQNERVRVEGGVAPRGRIVARAGDQDAVALSNERLTREPCQRRQDIVLLRLQERLDIARRRVGANRLSRSAVEPIQSAASDSADVRAASPSSSVATSPVPGSVRMTTMAPPA